MDTQYDYDDYDDVQKFEPEEEDWGSTRDLDLTGIDALDAWASCTEAENVSRETIWRIV